MTGLVTTISGCETESHIHTHIRHAIDIHIHIYLHVQVERSPERAVLKKDGPSWKRAIFRDALTRDETRRNADERERMGGRERESEREIKGGRRKEGRGGV